MKTISFLCPTRGRPVLFKRMCEAIAEKSENLSHVEVITYIDADDVESRDITFFGVCGEKIIGPHVPMSVANKTCLEKSTGDIIVLMNDDVVIRTQGWDTLLREAVNQFPDEVYLVYPNDLFKRNKLCTFPILSRRLCDVLVEPFSTQYQGNFIDTHLLDIFQRLKKSGFDRVRYLENIVFEHMHYRLGKGEFDGTYQARRRFGDDVCFVAMSEQRRWGAKHLMETIQGSALTMPPVRHQPVFITSFLGAFKHYIRIFAFNTALPLRWRMWLFTHFLARYWAGKIVH